MKEELKFSYLVKATPKRHFVNGKVCSEGVAFKLFLVDEFSDETLTTVLGDNWNKHHDTLRPNFPDIIDT